VNLFSASVLERTEELACCWIERVDRAVAEIADEQRSTEVAETRGSKNHPPRRVQRPLRDEALEEQAIQVKSVKVSVTRTRDIVMVSIVLFRIGDVEGAADVLNIERRKSSRYRGVEEASGQLYRIHVPIEDVDSARAEVRCIEKRAL